MSAFQRQLVLDDSEMHSERLEQFIKLKEGHEIFITNTILSRCALLLQCKNGNAVKQMKRELGVIISHFIEDSIILNAEESRVELWMWEELSEFEFEQNHPYFTGHQNLQLKEDQNDPSPDAVEAGIAGRKIDFVVEPAVLRFGNANGEAMDQGRVLLKGVVWMVKPEDLKVPRQTVSSTSSIEVVVSEMAPGKHSPPSAPTLGQNALVDITSQEGKDSERTRLSASRSSRKRSQSVEEQPSTKKARSHNSSGHETRSTTEVSTSRGQKDSTKPQWKNRGGHSFVNYLPATGSSPLGEEN